MNVCIQQGGLEKGNTERNEEKNEDKGDECEK